MSNIVTAVFEAGACGTVTSPLFQWDYGQVLQFQGLELPDTYEVHFANTDTRTSVTMLGNADGVDIPDACLTSGEPIYAWVFLHTGDDDGETEYTVSIPVIARAEPSDIEPTPVQQDIITQAIAALNSGVTRSEAAAESAEDSAEEAAANAEAAHVEYTDLSEVVNGHAKNLLNYNSYDILTNAARNSATSSGITWTWNTDGSCTVTGTATNLSVRRLMGGEEIIPSDVVPGCTYYIKYSGVGVYLQVTDFINGEVGTNRRIYSDTVVTFPNDITGMRVRLCVAGGNTVDETVNPVMLTAMTNEELSDGAVMYKPQTLTDAQQVQARANIGAVSADDVDSMGIGHFRGEKLVNRATALPDFDGAIINRYYSINVASGISNMPVSEKGHLLYFGLNGGSTTPQSGREAQIYITHNNDFWYRGNRFSTGAPWSNWKRLATADEIPDGAYMSLSMFQSIGIVGDSFASGEIYDADAGTHADYYNLSWGQVLARMCGITAVNYSKGALTTKGWLNNADYGLGKLNSETANNLYVVALGINDANHSDTIPVGTIADIESDTTESFYSYYGRIIRAIKSHASVSVIMLSTLPRFGTMYNAYSDAVRAIGEYYDLIVLDLAQNVYFTSTFFSTHQISNHPTAVNYSGMAKAYKDMIEKAIDAHASDFDGYVG